MQDETGSESSAEMWIEGRALYRRIERDETRSVTIALDLRGLTVRAIGGEEIAHWPFGQLERHPQKNALVIGPNGSVERVEISDPPTRAAFEAALNAIPTVGEPAIPRRIWALVVGGAVVTILLIWLVIWGLGVLAARIAPLIPQAAVVAIDRAGRASVLEALGSGEDRRCMGLEGDIALTQLAARLIEVQKQGDLRVSVDVYRSEIPNAVALPAGTIIVTSALLDLAGTPDELAGVIAHEISHVRRAHGLQKIVHDGGIALVLGLMTGDGSGALAGATRILLGASYSREAERQADDDAVDMVALAGGDPARLSIMLNRLAEKAGEQTGLLTLLATHPLSDERNAAIIARAETATRGPGPLVPAADWPAIRAICE